VRRALVCIGCIAAAACPAPADVTPLIHVTPGAAARWTVGLGHADSAPKARPARVHVMRDGEPLGGPNAIGRPGDIVLENDEVVFVIDRLGPGTGFAESGGNLVDAADARERRDELGQMFTCFGTFPRQGVYESLATGVLPDGSAWVEAKGHELYETKLVVRTRYTLNAPDRALLLETTLENTGDGSVEVAALGDAIQWGGAEKIAPGKRRGFTGKSSGPYVGGVGRFTSYAVTSTEGALDAMSGSSWTDTAQRKGIRLGPGETTAYKRVFIVGQRPDTASLVAELAQAAGQQVGEVDVLLRPAAGDAPVDVEVPPDARVSVQDANGAEVLTIHAAGTPPRLDALLLPGHWRLAYAGGGGRAGQSVAAVNVAAGERTHGEITVTRASGARVVCSDAGGSPLPCKVTFERTDGVPPPDFGPANMSGPARNQVTTLDGVAQVALARGAYRVTASRGPEYSLAQADVKLAPGEQADLRLSPKRVVDTRGYLGCDFHQHTMLSADAPVAMRDRVIANVAEGVEIAVASEHNVVADLEPVVKELHLERELVSIAGDELTSDASRHPWGHANAFPMQPSADKARGGAPPVRDRAAREIFDELRRSLPADFVLQVNHPRSGASGYFDRLGFDRSTGVGADPQYDSRFDALEVWNGHQLEVRGKVLDDFFALLRTGHPVTATANTDTHGIVGQEAGYPRTYVRVADDAHLDAWDPARTQDLVHGVKVLRDVVLTNGPMLRVTANGAPIGSVVRGRAVQVTVHVESAPWVVVQEVRLVRASAPDKPDVKRVVERATPAGGIAADTTFVVSAAADDAFVVIASGTQGLAPVLGPGPDRSTDECAPWAMTGAIWMDADADGRALGR
jgi:hypothetical protein